MADLSGKQLGQYRIIAPIGEGGMASVYQAFDTLLERQVAVKLIRLDVFGSSVMERILQRFEREAKALATLNHAHIIKVHNYGDYQGAPYLVMEYMPGGTLKDRLGSPIDPAEAARAIVPIARALAHSHRKGIIHRDLKPSNVLIDENGEPKLADFGIAKLLTHQQAQTLTGTGFGVGTPEYMAPEQGLGKPVDSRTDIYALGVLFYEMVTGRRPFEADTPMAVVAKHIYESLPLPSTHVPGLSREVEDIILKAMEKKPEDRFQGMEEMVTALEGVAGEALPIQALPGVPEPDVTRDDFFLEPTEPVVAVPKPPGGRPLWRDVPRWVWGLIAAVCLLGAAAGVILAQRGIFRLQTEPSPVALVLTPTPTLEPTPSPVVSSTPSSMPTETAIPSPSLTILPSATLMPSISLEAGSTITSPVDGMVVIYIPEGTFQMGSDGGAEYEKPAHDVFLKPFWMDQTEVTNAMYARCVETGTCSLPINTDKYANASYTDHPVTNVDWNQAEAYCQWAGRRLPTEAEWEKAARGVDGRTYPWEGTKADCEFANYSSCIGDTTPVGSYPKGTSPYGAYDMAGNVWEWVADWYAADYYSISPLENPEGPPEGDYRLLRGGSYTYFVRGSETFNRYWNSPTSTWQNFGFRCAMDVEDFGSVQANPTLIPVTQTIPTPSAEVNGSAGVIAFISQKNGIDQIFTIRPDGTGLTQFTFDPVNKAAPAWSPGGSRLAFESFRGDNREVFVVNADGAWVNQLTSHPSADFNPTWSPDGSRLAYHSYMDGNGDIYSMATDGSDLNRITLSQQANRFPSWSPDGSRIAFQSNRDHPSSGGPIFEIYVMNADGTEVNRLTYQEDGGNTRPTWSPDGSKIAFVTVRDGDYEIYLMDADGSDQVNLTNSPGEDRDPTWSPDGSKIAFCSNRDGAWEIYTMNPDGSDLENLTGDLVDGCDPSWGPEPPVHFYEPLTPENASRVIRIGTLGIGAVNDLIWSPDSQMLASDEGDTIHLWDFHTGDLIRSFVRHQEDVLALAISPDGKYLASGSVDDTIRLWDLATGALIRQIFVSDMPYSYQGVRTLAFSPDSTRLASGDDDRNVKVWDVETGGLLFTFTGHTEGVQDVAFSLDGLTLASLGESAKLWDLQTGEIRYTLEAVPGFNGGFAFSPDGTTLATGGYDATVLFWDTSTGEIVQTLTGHTSQIITMAFSPDGHLLASTGSHGGSDPDPTVRLWDVATGEMLAILYGHRYRPYVVFSPDGRYLVSNSSEALVQVWAVPAP